MKASRFSALEGLHPQTDGGARAVDDVRRSAGISQGTFHPWPGKYAGLLASVVRRLKALEGVNARLKKLVANRRLDKETVGGRTPLMRWRLPLPASRCATAGTVAASTEEGHPWTGLVQPGSI